MKTARQDRPALTDIDTASTTRRSPTLNQSVSVDVAARARVQFSTSKADLPALLHALKIMGLTPVEDTHSESITPVLNIQVAQQLQPPQAQCVRVRNDVMIEPSTLWVLDRTGAAVTGLPFATWDKQITALATPSRLNWLLRSLLPVALPTRGLLTGHGAAYSSDDGRGTVMCGLPHSGKTGATLAAVASGAKFLTDDLVVVDAALSRIEATTLPIDVAYSYLQQYPQYKENVANRTLAKLQRKTRALQVLRTLLPASRATKLLPTRIAKRWVNLLNTRLVIELPAATLFREDQRIQSAELENLVLLVATDPKVTEEGTTQSLLPEVAIRRWLLSVKRDTSELCSLFDLHQYTFPDTECCTLANHPATVATLLRMLFAATTQEPEMPRCRTHSLAVNWQQPNPERMYAGLLELNNRD